MAQKRLPRVLEREEVEALLAVPNTRYPTGLRNRAILETMYRAGLRVSEVCNLRPGDIAWKANVIRVQQGKGRKDRDVGLREDLKGWLRAWEAKRPGSKWFFCTLGGKQLYRQYIGTAVQRMAVKSLGEERGKRVSPHVLRHCYATNWLNGGGNIRKLQEALGHEKLNSTEVYLHVRPGEVVEETRRLEAKEKGQPQAEDLREKVDALLAQVQALQSQICSDR